MIRRYVPRSVEELAQWYIRYVSPFALIAGFICDNLFLLRRVDMWRSNALLFFYLVVSAASIVLINLIENGKLRHPFFLKILPIIPVIAQFAFGGLFSGYLSLYSRSADYAVSWIFVVMVALLLIGNERFVHWYRQFSFQISVYFTVLFSFLIFFLPVVFHRIGPLMFLISGVASLALISLFVMYFASVLPALVKEKQTTIARSVAIIFIVFNVLYFSNAIPPLPLALKDAAVYHSVVKNGANYDVTRETLPWYQSYLRFNGVFHRAPGEGVYVWTAVFAPTGLSTTIYHEWQHYDESAGEWRTVATIPFPINGGRDGGYRGYTYLSNAQAGRWRVNVVTPFKQIIGRLSFRIEDTPVPVVLENATQ